MIRPDVYLIGGGSIILIGFEDAGNFRFAHEILKWGYLDENEAQM